MVCMILFAILTRLGKKRATLVVLPLVSLFLLIHDVLAYSDLLASQGIKRESDALFDVIELLTSFVGQIFFTRYDYRWMIAFVETRFLISFHVLSIR